MPSTPTVIQTIAPEQFAARLAGNFPPGWGSPQAVNQPAGVLHNVLLMLGTELTYLNAALQYADDATRVQTAQNDALDLASLDYFGSGAYAIPRNSGESDASYRARLLGGMLPAGATRPAMYNALLAATGFPPRLIELWRPYDTGVIDGLPGAGMMFLDVDTAVTPGRIADPGLRYQALIQCVLPLAQPFGNNPTPCMDFTIFTDSPGSSMIDTTPTGVNAQQQVYDAINRTKCEGTICWVQFVPAPSGLSWDEPAVNWDDPGAVWQ